MTNSKRFRGLVIGGLAVLLVSGVSFAHDRDDDRWHSDRDHHGDSHGRGWGHEHGHGGWQNHDHDGDHDHDDCCRADADCASGQRCDDGHCRAECVCDADCGRGETCESGQCVRSGCATDADCAQGESCSNGQCIHPDDPNGSTDDGNGQPPPPAPQEICGDCIDNDGNGLTDFEDPACCGMQPMQIKRARIVSRGGTSRLRLRAMLARKGMGGVNPTTQDVFLQIRPAGGGEALCARVPASSFKRSRRSFRFKNRSALASAKGLSQLAVKIGSQGRVRMQARGSKVQMNVEPGPMQLTVGFQGATPAQNVCSGTTTSFHTIQHQVLVAQ